MAHDWEPFYIQLQRVLDENDDRDEQKCLGIEENLIFKMIKGHLQNNQEMNDTIEILKADNLRLINKFNNEKLKCLTFQEKLKTIVKNQELFTKLKQEYHTMLKSVKESKPIKEEDKSTSMDTLMDTSDKSIQISLECQHCLTTNDLSLINNTDRESQRKSVACQVTNYEGGHMSRRSVLCLQDDINILKELLNAREIIWGKLATRERVQRLQLHRLHAQLEDLHQLEFKQRVELELKNKRIQELTRDLEHEKLEVCKLKKQAEKVEGDEAALIPDFLPRT